MKKIQLFIIALFGMVFIANAQAKVNGKAVIKTPALICEECKDRLEQYLFRTAGITSVKADYKKHTVTVTWLTDRISLLDIKLAINNAGFDADDELAEETAAKKLPPCCKNVPVVKPALVVPPVVAPAPVVQPKVVMDTVKKVAVKPVVIKKTTLIKKKK